MKTKTCVVTGAPLSEANDSQAHIIPSALGGRLKPYGLLSSHGNELLNEKVDLPLIKAFQDLASIIGISRDRGESPKARLRDRKGNEYLVAFNEPISLGRPTYSEKVTPEGVSVQIEARTLKEARILLGRVKKQYPDFDIDKALEGVDFQSRYMDSPLGSNMQIGPSVNFPAAFVASCLFSWYHVNEIHDEFKNFVTTFDPNEEPIRLPPDTFYWYPKTPWHSPHGNDTSHTISLVTDATRGKSICFVEYFGILCTATLLPFHGQHSESYSYAVDVTTGENFNLDIDADLVRSMDWTATHRFPNEIPFDEISDRTAAVLSSASHRGVNLEIGRLVDKALGKPDGRVLGKQDVANICDQLTPFLLNRIQLASSRRRDK